MKRRVQIMRQDRQVAATTDATSAHRRGIRLWLNAIAALLVLMVMVGGATRLTDSGLSIVEWRPVTGVLPPIASEN
jgi:cytochrome c oxidase assembly protein subunit 15